jgi:hypothetical protein
MFEAETQNMEDDMLKVSEWVLTYWCDAVVGYMLLAGLPDGCCCYIVLYFHSRANVMAVIDG